MELNEVTLIGKLAQNPDLTTIGQKVQYLTIKLLIEETWEKDGKSQRHIEQVDVHVKNDAQANFVLGRCVEGDDVFVRGKLRTIKWRNNLGCHAERRVEAKQFYLLND